MSISVAIVIPVYREGSYIEKTLDSIEKSVQYSLAKYWIPKVVLVINNPIHISDSFRSENQKLIPYLEDFKKDLSYPIDILDYTNPGLQNGVGEARKVGMSYAIAKYLHDPEDRIVSLDADCRVSTNYISTLFGHSFKGAGFTLYFEHELDSEPIIYYELYLRYLRHGLSVAESRFDHYAVGSSLGTSVKHYQKVGGMVVKSATEDFHFMNKLRKIGKIEYWTNATITPSSRVSERVTLGTGYFLHQVKSGFDRAFEKLMVPSPKNFETLKKILHLFYTYNEEISLRDEFEKIEQKELYEDLHRRKVIEKVHSIYESTTTPENFTMRLQEIIDGLETHRILRFLTLKNPKITPDLFLSYANEIWDKNLTTAEQLLLHVRKIEKESNL